MFIPLVLKKHLPKVLKCHVKDTQYRIRTFMQKLIQTVELLVLLMISKIQHLSLCHEMTFFLI